VKDLSLLGRDI
jgi:CTD small phosphatase-like protein 2